LAQQTLQQVGAGKIYIQVIKLLVTVTYNYPINQLPALIMLIDLTFITACIITSVFVIMAQFY
jgi:hypothetical protein